LAARNSVGISFAWVPRYIPDMPKKTNRSYRPEFEAALRALARTSEAMKNAEGKAISLEELARDVERRRAAAGYPEMPRNSGKRRTASKQALLDAIREIGGKW
jgi:hypothetical protein